MENNSIFITKADKSNTLVIFNKEEYENKMNSLLNDSTTYEKLKSSPLKRLSSAYNKKVKLLKDVPNIEVNKFI